MSQGPYKQDGETVYATEPADSSDTEITDDDRPLHQQKGWLYQQYHVLKKSSSEIAETAGVTPSTVCRWMRKHEIPKRDLGEVVSQSRGGDRRLFDEDWVREQYIEQEKSTHEIAEECDVDCSVAYRALERFDITPRTIGEARKVKSDAFSDRKYNNEKWLRFQYHTLGKSLSEISDEYGWSVGGIRGALDRHGINTRSKQAGVLNHYKKEKCIPVSEGRDLVSSDGIDASWQDTSNIEKGCWVPYRDREWLQHQVDKGLSTREIADVCEIDVGDTTISTWINRLNITRDSDD